MKKNFQTIIKSLAIYQIAGGVVGIGLALRFISKLGELAGIDYLLIGLTALFYSFSIVAGFVLLKSIKRGLKLSLLNQAMQVVQLVVVDFAFHYVAGVKIGLGFLFAPIWQFKLNFSLSSFEFALNTESNSTYLGINVLALAGVYLIERLIDQAGDN